MLFFIRFIVNACKQLSLGQKEGCLEETEGSMFSTTKCTFCFARISLYSKVGLLIAIMQAPVLFLVHL